MFGTHTKSLFADYMKRSNGIKNDFRDLSTSQFKEHLYKKDKKNNRKHIRIFSPIHSNGLEIERFYCTTTICSYQPIITPSFYFFMILKKFHVDFFMVLKYFGVDFL